MEAEPHPGVLDDLLAWRISAARWQGVEERVEALADALDSGSDSAVQAAINDLDLASPLRVTRLGSTPVMPPPRRVRLLRNRLVHRFGEAAESGMTRSAPAFAATASAETLSQQFVVHVFAATTGPSAADADRRIRQLWARCAQAYAASDPVGQLGLPTALPDSLDEGALAARQNADGVQMIVRRDHDVLCLSLAAATQGVTWTQWSERWTAASAGDDSATLAIVTVYAATVASDPQPTPQTVRVLRSALPSTPDDFWCDDGTMLGDIALWELPPYGTGDRRLVTLAAADDDPQMSALVWSRGDRELTPFTRYLLNAEKIRFEWRVRNACEPVLARVEPEAATRWLTAMSATAEIAARNMSHCLRAAGLDDQPERGPLADDWHDAETLRDQLGYDLQYVRVPAPGRAASATVDAAMPTVGLVTVLPEEFAAMLALIDDPVSMSIVDDRATYRYGTIPSADPDRSHPVVLTMLGETGTAGAAHGVTNLIRSFRSISQVVMVGIAAGVPAPKSADKHVRLGDIVVGTWSVVDFDHLVETRDGPQRRQEFPRRSPLLADLVKVMAADEMLGKRPWEAHLAALVASLPAFARPSEDTDRLYEHDGDDAAPIPHPDLALSGHRPGQPKVHEGRIGSADRAIRSMDVRDDLARRHDLRAIEMEGRGVGVASFAESRDWFVVRGVSDYADHRMTKVWRQYAAAVAAAYVRALLEACRPIVR